MTKRILFPIPAVFILLLLCAPVSASVENTSGIQWNSYIYLDAEGNFTGETVITNDPLMEGTFVVAEDDVRPAYLQMRVDDDAAALAISLDGETFYTWPEDDSFTVNVYASSCLTGSYMGTVRKDSEWIALDTEARDFIVQDMRMLGDDTDIEIPSGEGTGFQFVLPHDGNFRDLYDMEEERQWYDGSVFENAGGSGTGAADTDLEEPAAEDAPGMEWSSHYYVDVEGNFTGRTVLVSDSSIEGISVKSQDEVTPVYLKLRIDGEEADLSIGSDGENFHVWTGNGSVTVNVFASSSESASYKGTVAENSEWIVLGADARNFLARDMRMPEGETVIEIPNSNGDGGGFRFVLSHDGNFSEIYDMEEARQWYEPSLVENAGGSEPASVTPEFKEKVDEYFTYFHDVAAQVEDASIQGGVGVLDAIALAAQVWSDYQEFKELGESASTQADREYFENVRSQVVLYLTTGALGAYGNNWG